MWTIDDNTSTGYLKACDNAVKEETAFCNFKSQKDYLSVVTGQTYEQGFQYLQKLKEKESFLLQDENIKKIKFGDSIGNPIIWNYKNLGNISATLIRYMNVLQELNDNFGPINDLSIVEIGGGYGGQCNMIMDFHEVKSYDIVDIPQAINLTKKYLKRMNNVDVEFISADEIITVNKKFDLLISNYAISELNKDTQDLYLEKLIKNSRMGYITYNALKYNESRNKPYSDIEFKEILKSFNFNVKSYNENVKKSECEVIVWKNDIKI